MLHYVLIFAAALAAGAINSVAGGGTLITFPTLLAIGIDPKLANGTSTVALWPGSVAGTWGYHRELEQADRRLLALIVPCVIGSIVGAWLLVRTPTDVFNHIIPFLILFATCLFMAQGTIQRHFDLASAHHARSPWLSWTMAFQFVVAVYGGYFGAGIGILMLAALSLMGHTDIHQMNGVKNLLATCINGVAAAIFVYKGLVLWQEATVMIVASIVGGVTGAGLARRMGRQAVRQLVIAVGFVAAVRTMWTAFH
ncbi:MAG TPA: sulfite exporter TauE/SafE family protein [Vicinamibacterales bacterium]|nr:sulfite exporter TauE/SafE family protein [Vicinamibacterales bacterium]